MQAGDFVHAGQDFQEPSCPPTIVCDRTSPFLGLFAGFTAQSENGAEIFVTCYMNKQLVSTADTDGADTGFVGGQGRISVLEQEWLVSTKMRRFLTRGRTAALVETHRPRLIAQIGSSAS